MLDKIIETLIKVYKSNKTSEFAKKSVENIARICITGDLESGICELVEGGKYIVGIKDILFWEKIKRWLENTYATPQMETKISTKFTKDEVKYKEYTKRQLQFIAQIDEEEKIDYYANLTRSWLLGYIDSALYFKMSYLLRVFTLEELTYLKDNYTPGEISEINFYIREFSLYGLIDVVVTTNLGNSRYKYSDLAEIFIRYGWMDTCIATSKKYLKDLKVENTKTCMEIVQF